ncbi:sensor histidine kinase [Bacillus sp. BRMEA1]|uniref:GAF domain-containing sensor histidine kinase n=1 Tax=Neobacillus endophyticus TaxID=2738405 RepID=UPI0015678D7F|nr:sensor histidine kinase [Neobacillus endophyticus]NRD77255.1 sensor histidine kinase [Neobacillus endophyticus]
MNGSVFLQKRERFSRLFLLLISIIGTWIFIQFGLFTLTVPSDMMIFSLLAIFLFIVELFPLPVWKGAITISFPLVYVIYHLDGWSTAIVTYGMISASINLLKQRPLRIIFFNTATIVISLYFGSIICHSIYSVLPLNGLSKVIRGIIYFNLLMLPFYLINNLIIDILLAVRPQAYSLTVWKRKTLQEGNSFLLSLGYLILFYILGNQNRGKVDVISFFFFFSPLVCFSLLSSIIANLKREKAKLKALFSISSELNEKIAGADWLTFLKNNLQEFIDVDAWILWRKEQTGWRLSFAAGQVANRGSFSETADQGFNNIRKLTIYHNIKKAAGPAGDCFTGEICSLLYAPLMLENEMVGMFVFGRSRTKSFGEEDRQSAATLANQLAVLFKTKWLFAEQEKKLILEERNRIARDIHDGVAQSLAGAILNLETAQRKFIKMPEDSLRLITESTEKLRISLKEVRESIYALRPYPTERVGLFSAITAKIKAVEHDAFLPITIETRGQEFQLSPMSEKIIFDICQESMQNAIKHAEASKIEILLSYQKEHVLLKVKDNGKGFSLFQAMIKARENPHFGILQMNEAAEKIHASLQVDSREGAGTEITLTVPRMGIEGSDLCDQAYASR